MKLKNEANQLLESLNWRYATKSFDSTRLLGNEQLSPLLESLRLAPSSFGLQPWKFLVISDPETKQKLFPFSWGNRQVLDCSHLVVLCSLSDIGESEISRFLSDYKSKVSSDDFNVAGYGASIRKFIEQMSPSDKQRWMAEQVYIALGILLSAAATMRIDSCPMGGFLPHEYDRILGLADKGLKSVVVCALGFRTEKDKFSSAPRVRFHQNQIIEFIS